MSLKINKRIILTYSIFIVIIAYLLYSNSNLEKNNSTNNNTYNGKKAKYVFYFIGDGMGIPQVNAAEAYLAANSDIIGIKELNISHFPAQALFTTYAENRYITGSAAAATALATGHKTTINTISMDGSRQRPLKTIAEIAKDNGMKVGIITSVSIDHATPACFYAHQPLRSKYYEIGIDLANSNFDFFGGGGFKSPAGKNNKKINSIELAKKNGYKYVNTKEDFNKLNNSSGKVIAVSPILANGKALRYAIDQNKDDITLADFTSKAIEVLDNEKGFFLMVEGGKIDWACHANDAATVIHEVIDFDAAVGKAIDFYKKHPKETSIVVVGDHETGGLTIGFAGTKYESSFKLINNQKVSFEGFNKILSKYKKNHNKSNAKFSDILALLKENFGLGNKNLELSEYELFRLKEAFNQSINKKNIKPKNIHENTYLLYGGYEPITVTATHILNQKAGIAWTTYSHTGTPIPVRVMGVGQNVFKGYFDNTDIPKKMLNIMDIKQKLSEK